MIKNYYKDSRRIKRLRECLLGEYMDAFANSFAQFDYSIGVVKAYLRTAAHFARYAVWEGNTEVSQLNHEMATQFLNEHLPNCSCEKMNSGKFANATAGIDHLMRFLVEQGVIEAPIKMMPQNQMSDILIRYDQYLDKIFGLTVKTRNIHRKRATTFMEWLRERHGELNLEEINNNDILDFQIAIQANKYSFDFKKTITSCLRSFLRFLRWEHIVHKDFTPAVYKLVEWDLASIPKYMPYDDVLMLLQAPDRNTAVGKRDVTMLILMAHLGLRACEIVNLHISEIDFRNGTILIKKTKTSVEREMPLTVEIAEVLIDYIKNGRQNQLYDRLFLRTYAPYTPIQSSSSVGTMIRKYIKEIGLKTPTLGTHQLRHSLATHLINNGSTLKDVADMLGHKSIESTGIYAKVHVERLKEVALPFPMGGALK
ncbi:MAG: site-specific integrase [Eubacteriales bacterium]|nr:site-specific integrase [Eubacteriales bacterium]